MNEQDPLSQLRDIHLPDPHGWWPPAPGWWIVAALLLAGLAFAGWTLYRHWRSRSYRRVARTELDSAWLGLEADRDRAAYLQALNRILRRVARQSYPQYPLNSLQGEQWLNFLDQSLANRRDARLTEQFRSGPGRLLLTGPYRPNHAIADGEGDELKRLHELAIAWIGRHGTPAPAKTGDQALASRHAKSPESRHAGI